MENIKFSVIIPAYNCENEIENAVNTVIMQNYENYEIIIVNDGSTDNTKTVIEKLIENNGKIKLINQCNSGPATARNKGIEIADGDYILFIDSDDKFREGLFNRLYSEIIKKKSDLLIFGFSQIFLNDGKVMNYKSNDLFYDSIADMGENFGILYKGNLFNQVWNKAINRKFIEQNGILFKNYKFGEDRLFIADILKKCKGIKCIGAIYYDYIIDSNLSLISSFYDKKCENVKECRNEFVQLNELSGNDDNSYINFMFLKGIISCLTVLYSEKNNFSKDKIKKEFIKVTGDSEVKTVLSQSINCGFAYEIIRKILISDNYFISSTLIKLINFTQINLHNIFLKFRM